MSKVVQRLRPPSWLAEALFGERGHEAILDAQDDVAVVAAGSLLVQEPAGQQGRGLTRNRCRLSPPSLTVTFHQPAPTGVRAVPYALLRPARYTDCQLPGDH